MHGVILTPSRAHGPGTGKRDEQARVPSVKQQVRPCAAFWHWTGLFCIYACIVSGVLRRWPFGGRRFSPEIERIIRRRRLAAWTAVAAMVSIAVAGGGGA